jgi:hypothetical protein
VPLRGHAHAANGTTGFAAERLPDLMGSVGLVDAAGSMVVAAGGSALTGSDL